MLEPTQQHSLEHRAGRLLRSRGRERERKCRCPSLPVSKTERNGRGGGIVRQLPPSGRVKLPMYRTGRCDCDATQPAQLACGHTWRKVCGDFQLRRHDALSSTHASNVATQSIRERHNATEDNRPSWAVCGAPDYDMTTGGFPLCYLLCCVQGNNIGSTAADFAF